MRLCVAAWILIAAGCAAHAPPAPRAAEPVRDPWSETSWEDRHDTMTFAVLPNMARLFQRFRGTRDPDLTCRSCHGADAEAVRYEMPHGLGPLDPAHLPDRNSVDPKEARMARFMADEVTPAMADLIGMPLYDPRTGRGFGCFDCHPAIATARRAPGSASQGQ